MIRDRERITICAWSSSSCWPLGEFLSQLRAPQGNRYCAWASPLMMPTLFFASHQPLGCKGRHRAASSSCDKKPRTRRNTTSLLSLAMVTWALMLMVLLNMGTATSTTRGEGVNAQGLPP